MIYSVQDIIKDVRIALDENEASLSLTELGDIDTLSLDTIIRSKITDAARSVSHESPTDLLDEGKSFAQSVEWETGMVGKGMGYVYLPEDFMRLVIFQMSDWKRPVLIPIRDTDSYYLQQKSRFAGIKGGIDRPVCAITTYPMGKVMEFYSCSGGNSVYVKSARYLPYPAIVEGNIELCRKLYTPIIYYTAGLVCMTYKEKEHADVLFAIANDYLK